MSKNGLEYLKSLEISDIQSKTHISLYNLNAILNRAYGKLEPVHFTGFISILEREYAIDLSEIAQEYEVYANSHVIEKPFAANVYITEKKEHKKRKTWLVISFLFVAAAGLFFYNQNNETRINQDTPERKELNDSQIEEAKEKLEHLETLTPYMEVAEKNDTVLSLEKNATMRDEELHVSEELNATQVNHIVKQIISSDNTAEEIVIIPKKKVWIGMIELPQMKKINRMTTQKITVDKTKDSLIVFGHGQVDIQKNSELLNFSDHNKLYFIYEQGKLRQLNRSEFKSYNQGKMW
jgi:hypothetical protein